MVCRGATLCCCDVVFAEGEVGRVVCEPVLLRFSLRVEEGCDVAFGLTARVSRGRQGVGSGDVAFAEEDEVVVWMFDVRVTRM